MAWYVDDITPTGTLHLAIVRSPFANAVVTSIDIEGADEVPGVWAIITPEDAAGLIFVD
jgi:carbon-monoxide dehydrogenase large subunit